MHTLLHIFGIDTQQSYWYDFWSGIATQASLIFAGLSVTRKYNCHQHHCWRVGRHTINGTPWCDHHHLAARRTYNEKVPTQES